MDIFASGIDINKLKRAFLEESEELLEKLDSDLIEFENRPDDPQLINDIFRVMHSLKSESSALGYTNLSSLAHKLEDVFEKVRSNELVLDREKMDLILNATDAIHEIINNIVMGGNDGDVNTGEIIDELKLISGETVTSTVQSSQLDKEKLNRLRIEKIWEFSDFELDQLREARERKENFYRLTCDISPESPMKYARAFLVFTNLEQVVNVIKTIPSFGEETIDDSAFSKFVVYLTADVSENDIYNAAEIDEVQKVELIQLSYEDFLRSEGKKEKVKKEQETVPRKIEKTSIRVETKKIDELWFLVGELIIYKSQIEKLLKKVADQSNSDEINETIESTIDSLDKISERMQQAMMETRMVPIDIIFKKLPRLIRDLSKKLGKEVHLEISGEETEIDRSIVEALSEPITHLIRNSLDHGIEFPEERVSKGKDRAGKIKVSAFQEGGNIILQIEDDGKGFDIERIREIALSKGFLSKKDNISQNDLLKLVFKPGFSTKEEITELSGRGVGMDVVANKIKGELRGDVHLQTVKDKGTKIVITLPLTLTIIESVIVMSKGEYYAIPVRRVEETIEVLNTELFFEEGTTLYNYRGNSIPVIYFDKLVGKRTGKADENYGVIIRHGSKMACLIVDRLIEEQDIVIKPIDDMINARHLFSGISILGDGKIVYIVDTSTILESLKRGGKNGGQNIIS